MAAIVAASLLTFAHFARADEARATAQLSYDVSADIRGCADEAMLRRRIAERLGYDFVSNDAGARLRANIREEGQELRATFSLDDASGIRKGERTLSAGKDECDELSSTMALSIAILLDPHSVLGPVAPPPPSPPPPPTTLIVSAPEPSPFDSETPLPSPTLDDPDKTTIRLGGGPITSVGVGPGPALGATVVVGVARGPWSADFEGRADLPSSTARDDGTQVTSSVLVGQLVPCGRVGVLRLCLLVAAGAMNARGTGAGAPETASKFYAASGIRVAAELPLATRLLLRVHPDLWAPLTPTSLAVARSTLWTTPPLALSFGADLLAQFP
jgi:hypothetical protein